MLLGYLPVLADETNLTGEFVEVEAEPNNVFESIL